jgi:acyl-CoA thioesterase-1
MSPFSAGGAVPGYGARRALCNLVLALALLLAAFGGRAGAEVRILAFGDSLTQGYGLPERQGFVPQLEAWLHANGAPDVTVINGGVSGDTTAGGLARIGWALGDDVDAVIVALGGNDLLRGLDIGAMQKNLDGILTEIDRRNLPVLLAGLPAPPNYGPEYRRAFKAAFRDLATAHGAIYVGSFLGGMGDGRSVRQVMRLMQPDGIHPNADGVTANVAHIGPAVLKLVALARERE